MSIGVSRGLYKGLHLKTVIGTNNFTRSIRDNIQLDNQREEIEGRFSASQVFLEVLPQYHCFKDKFVFINAGIGFAGMHRTELVDGFYVRTVEAVDGGDVVMTALQFPSYENNYTYFTTNVGLQYNYKGVGIVGEFGYRHTGDLNVLEDMPALRLRFYTIKAGVSYQLN